LQRKLSELLITAEFDRELGKARILELYANVVEWGPGIRGIKSAAEHYFGKQPADMNATEVAWLVTALPDPRRFHRAWQRGSDRGAGRVNTILKSMHRLAAISAEELELALLDGLPRRCDYWPAHCP
jgi:membrane peptidoglycan carboxypeptidase